MSVAFAIEVTRSAAESRWRMLAAAIPACGLATSALQLQAGPTFALDGPPGWRVAAAAACALGAAAFAVGALVSLRRPNAGRTAIAGSTPSSAPVDRVAESGAPDPASRPRAARTLIVDETGRPALREPGEPTARPMALHAWCTLPGLTLLVMAPYLPQPPSGRRARPATLLLGRDGLSDEGWRRLHVWLRWIERGRLERPTP